MKARKRYTANQPATRAVSELIEQFGARVILEAVADYCACNLGLQCFAPGLRSQAEVLRPYENGAPLASGWRRTSF